MTEQKKTRRRMLEEFVAKKPMTLSLFTGSLWSV